MKLLYSSSSTTAVVKISIDMIRVLLLYRSSTAVHLTDSGRQCIVICNICSMESEDQTLGMLPFAHEIFHPSFVRVETHTNAGYRVLHMAAAIPNYSITANSSSYLAGTAAVYCCCITTCVYSYITRSSLQLL